MFILSFQIGYLRWIRIKWNNEKAIVHYQRDIEMADIEYLGLYTLIGIRMFEADDEERESVVSSLLQ